MSPAAIPEIGPSVPRRGWRLARRIGRRALAAARWRVVGEVPDLAKAVIIVAPHTSNWDFPVGVAAMLALDLELTFLGKHTLFEGPLAPLMRGLGGIPVDRSHPGSGVVEEMAARFRAADRLLLALSPEGTRSTVDRWKTGFYRIAAAAEVPIVAVALDWGRREIRFGPVVAPSGDLERDLAVFQQFFAGAHGKKQNPGRSPAST